MPSPQAGATSQAEVPAAVEGGRRQTGTGVATRKVQGHPASRQYRLSAARRVGVATATTKRPGATNAGAVAARSVGGTRHTAWPTEPPLAEPPCQRRSRRSAPPCRPWPARGGQHPPRPMRRAAHRHAGKPVAATTKKRRERYGGRLDSAPSCSQRWVPVLFCTSRASGGAAEARFPRCATAAGIRRQHPRGGGGR